MTTIDTPEFRALADQLGLVPMGKAWGRNAAEYQAIVAHVDAKLAAERVVTHAQVLCALHAFDDTVGSAITLQPLHLRLAAMRAALEAALNPGELHVVQRLTAGR